MENSTSSCLQHGVLEYNVMKSLHLMWEHMYFLFAIKNESKCFNIQLYLVFAFLLDQPMKLQVGSL